MSDKPYYTDQQVLALTRQWVETMVVGLNLCPFAAPVVRQQTLRYQVCHQVDEEGVAAEFLAELGVIQQASEQEIATSLFIMPRAVPDFYDYLDLLALLESLLQQAGLVGTFQLASFHPGYRFAGVDPQDISHWTNRSPFPMVHFIREAQMDRVLQHFADPEAIPERNIKQLRALGREQLIARFPPFAEYT